MFERDRDNLFTLPFKALGLPFALGHGLINVVYFTITNFRKMTVPGGNSANLMRIAKAIARSGLCSRRDAERLIAEGRVVVNGEVLESPALNVGPGDNVLVDGTPLGKPPPVRLWRYHKPKGQVTTHKDPQNRPTVFDAMPEDMPRIVSIGRLDINTEGLLLLTTDGALARHLELPATGWLRRYRVRARGKVSEQQLDRLKNGAEIDGISYGPVEAVLDRQQGANSWLTFGLREGKNREVKRLAAHLGLEVNRLIRISFGPFMLGDLKQGALSEITPKVLAEQIGPSLARQFRLKPPSGRRRGRHGKRK